MVHDQDMIKSFYESYEDRVALVRNTLLQHPLTFTEKILYTHLYSFPTLESYGKIGEYAEFTPDRVAMQDISAQMALLQFMNAGLDKVSIPTSMHCDHLIKAHQGAKADLETANVKNEEMYKFLRDASSNYGIDFWKPGAGTIHQVVLEKYAFPGGMVMGTDSHTPNAGGLGMMGIGISGTDAVELISGVGIELKVPKLIGIHLTGHLNGWVSPKDIILKLVGIFTVNGGANAIIEYFGEGTSSISATGKATICNMSAEMGAMASIFPYDERMSDYLSATQRAEIASWANTVAHELCADMEVLQSPSEYYDVVIEINLTELEPYINGPLSPEVATPISEFAEKVLLNGYPRKVDVGLVGSCTNSSYEDLNRAASVIRQAIERDLPISSQLIIIPGSEQINATAERDGMMTIFRQVGGKIMANACGPCIGQWSRIIDDPSKKNSIVTSFNRNFSKRADGNPNTFIFVASPDIVTALTIAGDLCFNPLKDRLLTYDGEKVKLGEPSGDDLPEYGFIMDVDNYIAPATTKSEIKIDSQSDKLQYLQPFEAWDGNDLVDMALLIKIKGKCSTDQISVPGPWLKFRGHLENISDNFLMGAFNAFNGRMNKVWNRLTNDYDKVSSVAKMYKSNQINSIIVAEEEYGYGSNCEHAVLEPRFLNVRAILAKSFAHTHENNLKKQGILPLIFVNDEDYDCIQEHDLISIIGLTDLTPGINLQVELCHQDGKKEIVEVKHTYNKQQISWFRAGSALNARKL